MPASPASRHSTPLFQTKNAVTKKTLADEKLLNLGVYNPFQTDIHRLSENIINLCLVSWQVINISCQ